MGQRIITTRAESGKESRAAALSRTGNEVSLTTEDGQKVIISTLALARFCAESLSDIEFEKPLLMPGATQNANVLCPFYATDNHSLEIHCESPWKEMDYVGVGFHSKTAKSKYQKRFCMRHCWNECPIANLLNEKWGIENDFYC